MCLQSDDSLYVVVDPKGAFAQQRFPPNSLPKMHTLQSTVKIFHRIIMVSQYLQTVETL